MRSRAQQFVLTISLAAMLSAMPGPVCGHEFDTTSAWLPEVEQLYRPDVHYSQTAAVDALARDLAQQLKNTGDVSLQVRCAEDTLCREVKQAIEKAGLQHSSAGSSLVLHVAMGENRKQAVTFYVTDLGIEMTASFVSKPWVSATPGGFLVVRGLAEADLVGKSRNVIAQAVDTVILPRIRKTVGQETFPDSWWSNRIAKNRAKLLLEDSSVVVDRFQQTFYTSIDGEQHIALVREAMLLDVNEEKMAGITQPIVRDLHRARRRWSLAVGFAAVTVTFVLFVCCIGYTFVNRVTQGYYVWWIRLTTAALLVVSVTLAARIALSILHST